MLIILNDIIFDCYFIINRTEKSYKTQNKYVEKRKH